MGSARPAEDQHDTEIPRWVDRLKNAVLWLGVIWGSAPLVTRMLPAPLGAQLEAATTRAAPLIILLMLPLGTVLITVAVRARPVVLTSWGIRLILVGSFLAFWPLGIGISCVLLVPSFVTTGGRGPAIAVILIVLLGFVLALLGCAMVLWEMVWGVVGLARVRREGR